MNKIDLSFLPRSLTPYQTVLITLWVLVMVSLPIVDWAYGWEVMFRAIFIGVLVQVSAVVAILWDSWGRKKTISVVLLVPLLSWIAEAVSSHNGFLFGGYSYTEALQPQLMQVPVLIPLAWLMMLPPSWGVAYVLSRQSTARWRTLIFVVLSALAMTAWDLFLDPQMVAWGIWEWHTPGGYFGIPWSNYLGWLLVSAAITALLRPDRLPTAPLLLIYTTIWLLQTVGLGIFWGLPGPAVVGGIVMGSFTILAWRVYLQSKSGEAQGVVL